MKLAIRVLIYTTYLFLLHLNSPLFAQNASISTTIKGAVIDIDTGEPVIGANIIVKGLVIGTISDLNGEFKLSLKEPLPQTLQISYVGHQTITRLLTSDMVNSDNEITDINIQLSSETLLGQEIVVSASRYEEGILETPITIEKMGILEIRESASDTYYKALSNLKGVDVAHSSINFQILNARGFSSTGNVRFVQQIDGMDTQAPALNFPIGNLNGPSELDIESVELIPGASSAIYGPNAFNGIVRINSKSPFNYQGLSAFLKLGINHIGQNYVNTSPMYEASLRYAKAFKNKLAFKVNFSYMKAEDWWGVNYDDRAPFNQGELSFNPGSDLVHKHGDEAGINLAIFPLSSNWNTFARTIGFFEPGLTAETYAQAGDLPSTTVTLTPYDEQYLADYGAENFKMNAALNYRITDKIEASYAYNAGFGTSMYTGAQRYALSNFGIQQHKLEITGDNFMLRGYGTFENSGDSYIAEFLALTVNNSWIKEKWGSIVPNPDVSSWLGGYGIFYLEHLYQIGLQPGDVNTLTDEELVALTGRTKIEIQEDAHNYAREISDEGRFEPGSADFEEAKEKGRNGVIPYGATFADKSSMLQFEGNYDFKNEIKALSLQTGIMYRQFNLNSNGTIFNDIGGLNIKEYGAFIQAGKSFIDEKLRLYGSLRFDKNENFKGQLNPRLAIVYEVVKNNFIRTSFQTGFRNPTTQNQHIDLDIVSRRLLGGLPQYANAYQVDKNSYTLASVEAYTQSILNNGATVDAILDESLRNLLVKSDPYDPVRPEQIQAYEVGYKSLISGQFMIDALFYYNVYNDFIGAYRVRKANGDVDDSDIPTRIGARASLLNGTSDNTFDLASNYTKKVSAFGSALGFNYIMPSGFLLGGNWNWNRIDQKILNENPNFLFAFNTPENKFNISIGNKEVIKNLGFNFIYRWQQAFRWESTFAIGDVPDVSTLDAQFSYKVSSIKSIFKLGANNILNTQYVMNYGGPEMGAIYYFSITFDEFLN